MSSTIYDVAREAGLSIATVSRVINGKGGVSPKTEERVRAAVEKLQYAPNASAQGLASNSSRSIGLLLRGGKDELTSDYTVGFLAGACKAATEREYDVLLCQKASYLSARTRQKIEGALFASKHDEDPFLQEMMKEDFPVVYAGTRLPNDHRGQNVYGGFHQYRLEALELLYQRGCRRILFMESTVFFQSQWAMHSNELTIRYFLERHGMSEDQLKIFYFEQDDFSHLYSDLKQELLDYRPDGIFTTAAEPCYHVYTAISRVGLRIPQDIKVVSASHNENCGELYHPQLTTFCVDAFNMGYQAAHLLIDIISGKEPGLQEVFVPYKYLPRGSH